MSKTTDIQMSTVLENAIKEPGRIMEAYNAFHGYSFQNQMLALFQCVSRDIQPGPIATFKAWQDKGRHVKKGEKALTLLVPCTFKKEEENADGETESKQVTFFKPKNLWFALAQTEGENVNEETVVPNWDKTRALKALGIELVPFDMTDGNVQGFARGKQIAINPVAQLPHKTLFHEIAHILLGHQQTDIAMHDGADLPRNLKEVEAESTALLCLSALNLPGAEFCRGYIQGWWGAGNPIPETSAKKILAAAGKILAAGREETGGES